jgi:hydroxymethylbilane synthase
MQIIIGSRQSPLARKQVQELLSLLKKEGSNIKFEIKWIKTKGDMDQKTSLRELGKDDFFTKELDELLLSKQIRLAVHSGKDLPSPLPWGLKIAAITEGLDPSDSLVLRRNATLESLVSKSKIGTSSKQRESSVQLLRKDLTFCDIRGTIESRLQQLEDGFFDGVVIAEAALIRLGITHLNRISLPGPTTPLQGQLAVVIHKDDKEMEELFSSIDSRQLLRRALYLGLNPKNFNFKGKVTHYPVIKITPIPFNLKSIKNLPLYTHIIFTSKSSVSIFFKYLQEHSSLKKLEGKSLIAVGKHTRSLIEEHGLKVSVIPEEETSEGIVKLLNSISLKNAYILYPHSAQSRPIITSYFKEHQLRYDELILYTPSLQKTTPSPNLSLYDTLVFTSPSTVDGFLNTYDTIPLDKEIQCIGPITLSYLKSKL